MGAGRPEQHSPLPAPRLSIGWEGTGPRASPAAEAEMIVLMAHHGFKNRTRSKQTNTPMAAKASFHRLRGEGGGNDVLGTLVGGASAGHTPRIEP